MSLGGAIGAAAVAFIVTNLDDLLVLSVFFGHVHHHRSQQQQQQPQSEAQQQQQQQPNSGSYGARHIVVGQYLGFSILVIVSLIGFLSGRFISTRYIGLLGFVPLLMGAWSFLKYLRERCCGGDDDDKDKEGGKAGAKRDAAGADSAAGALTSHVELLQPHDTPLSVAPTPVVVIHVDEAAAQPMAPQQQLQHHQKQQNDGNAAGSQQLAVDQSKDGDAAVGNSPKADGGDDDDDDDDEEVGPFLKRLEAACRCCVSPHVARVAVVTVANGGDNIGIYAPLFAALTPGNLVATLIVFYVLVAFWCLVSYKLTGIKAVVKVMHKFGDVVIPLFLMALGIYILYEAGSFTLFE